MRVYHTSNVSIPFPDTHHSRRYLDFGSGFYLTPLEKQARDYGQRFVRRGEAAILNVYELSEVDAQFTCKRFQEYDGEWLDYIVACRKDLPHERYDVIMGGIADDQVFDTVDLYLTGVYTRSQALDQLRWKKPNYQLCVTSQQVIDAHLKYIESIKL